MAFSYSPKIVTEGLVLYLDAANPKSFVSGSTVCNDISKSQLSGTLYSGVSYDTSNGGCFIFDGNDDWIEINSSSTSVLNITSDKLTLCAFVNYQTTSDWQTIFYKDSGNSQGYQLFINDQNKIAFGVRTNTGFTRLITPSALDQNSWKYITTTYDGSLMKIYIDGALITSTSKTGNITSSSTRNLWISYSTYLTEYFLGKISTMKIYNRSLTNDEILQNYNATKTRFVL
jgi:hypothetical protein